MEFMNKKKPGMPAGFEPIRSAKDDRANASAIRELIKIAGGKSFRGGAGFLEANMEDMMAKGGKMYGRCCMHPEAAVGIKTYGLKVPKCIPCTKRDPGAVERMDNQGNPCYWRELTKDERREANKKLKEIKYLIGCNMNGSTIGKCVTAAAFLKLGIRCRLESNRSLLVDNWPDYDKCDSAMSEFMNKYNVHSCVS